MKTILLSLLVAAQSALAGNVSSTWHTPASGDWRTAAAWANTPAHSAWPQNGTTGAGWLGYDVTLSATGSPYTIALPTSLSLDSVSITSPDANVTQSIGTVRVINGLILDAGTWTVNGGTLSNTTITQSGGSLRFGSSTGKLDNCTVNGELDFPATNGHALLMNGSTFSGNANLTGNYTTLGLRGTHTLGGVRTVSLDGLNAALSAEGEDAVLTLGNFLLVRGRGVISTGKLTNDGTTATVKNYGTIRGDVDGLAMTIDADYFNNYGPVEAVNGGEVVIKSAHWANAAGGTLRAAGAGARLRLDGTWSNAGWLQMTDSRLELAGNFTTDGLGLSGWTRSGGTVEVIGDWDNSDKTMTLNAATGDFVLKNGDITGGTLVSAGARLSFTNQGGNLDGVHYQGGLLFDKTSDHVLLKNGSDFTGDTALKGNYSSIGVAGGTLAGGKTILLDATNPAITVEGVDNVLTLAGGLTVHGRGYLKAGNQLVSTNARIVNSGRVSADISGQTLTIEPPQFENKGTAEALNNGTLIIKSPQWVNTGTLRAVNSKLKLDGAWDNNGAMELTNATLEMAGTFDTADLNLSGWTRTGGAVDITGDWDNTGNSLDLTPATGSFMLRNGTITGGSIAQSGGAHLLFHSSGGELSGVAVSGDLILDKTSDRVLFRDGSTFSGNALLTGNYASLGFEGANVITGPKVIHFNAINASISAEGVEASLTLGADVNVRGRGFLKDGVFLVSSNTTLRNQGRITADTSGQNLTIETDNFHNEGIAEAVNNGTLVIKSPNWNVDPVGTLQADGGNLTFEGHWYNGGALSLTNSKLKLDGTFSTPGLGLARWTRTGGTVDLAGDLNNTSANLILTPATGDIRLVNGTITGGTIIPGAQRVLFTNSGGTLHNVRWQGDLRFEETASHVYLTGGSSFTGHAVFTANSTRLSFGGHHTLTGVHDLNMLGTSAVISVEGTDSVLTLGPEVTIHGRGELAHSRLVTSANTRIVNHGVIAADLPGQKLNITTALTQESTGTLEARGGTLELPAGFELTAGFLRNAGGIVQINGTGATSVLVLNGGQLEGVGQIKPVSAAFPLTVLAGDTVIAPGSTSTGELIIRGDLISTASTQFQFELSETAAGAGFTALSEAGTQPLTIAGSLSVRMVNGFAGTVRNTDVIALLTSNQALSGSFANAPHGSRLTTADGTGSFQINYGPSSAYGNDRVVLSHWQSVAPVGFAAWAASYGLSGANALATADPDKDGLTNVIEYAFALTPVQPGGFQYLPAVTTSTAGHTVLTFSLPATLPADITCAVEASADLATWQTITACSAGTWTGNSTSTPAEGRTVITITDTATAARRYLRLKVVLSGAP
jgi:hypothetical protein